VGRDNLESAATTSRSWFTQGAGRWRQDRLLFAGIVVASLAGAALLYRFEPVSSGIFPPCPFRAATGLHCPGCGSTRGMHALLHGRIWAAFRYNALLVLALPFLALAFARFTRRVFTRDGHGARPQRILPAGWIWALFVLVTAYWGLRNLPFRPFVWLAPTDVTVPEGGRGDAGG